MNKDSAILPPRPGRRIDWPAVVGVLLVVIVTALVLCPLSSGSPHTQKSACFGNLIQIGLGEVMYATDNDDRFPLKPWTDSIQPYSRNEFMLHCPIFLGRMDWYGYSMDSKQVGAKSPDTGSASRPQSQEPLVFDSIDLGRNSVGPLNLLPNPGRHDGQNNIVYADTHAKSIPLGGVQ